MKEIPPNIFCELYVLERWNVLGVGLQKQADRGLEGVAGLAGLKVEGATVIWAPVAQTTQDDYKPNNK